MTSVGCAALFPSIIYRTDHHLPLHSFPTRRSSDLATLTVIAFEQGMSGGATPSVIQHIADGVAPPDIDRKSTRLNSSHMSTSYAVFCLKKIKRLRLNPFSPFTTTTSSSLMLSTSPG